MEGSDPPEDSKMDASTPSPREIDALKAILKCGTQEAAAKRLGISYDGVRAHVAALRTKSRFHFTPQIVAWAMSNGWITREDLPEK